MFKKFTPKFVKQYAQLSPLIEEAVDLYINEVKEKKFPTQEHTFKIEEEILKKLK